MSTTSGSIAAHVWSAVQRNVRAYWNVTGARSQNKFLANHIVPSTTELKSGPDSSTRVSGNSEGTILGWEVLRTERPVISAGDKGDDGFDSDDSVSSPQRLLKTSLTAEYLCTRVCSRP